jgi:histidinol-phosphatase (PHP family)
MDPEETEGYVSSLLALREEYAGRIDILIGFEVEHLPARIAAQDELFARFPVDYLICGQHYVGDGSDEWNGDWSGAPTADEARLAAYADRCIEAMESGRYLYLAHPDVLNFTGPDETYARHMGRLCDCLAALDSPVEVNLLGVADNRHYPSERFLRLAAEHGCRATIGVDAHRPAALLEARFGVEERALGLCARCGLPVDEPPVPEPARR